MRPGLSTGPPSEAANEARARTSTWLLRPRRENLREQIGLASHPVRDAAPRAAVIVDRKPSSPHRHSGTRSSSALTRSSIP
jgi:hypothetical protein